MGPSSSISSVRSLAVLFALGLGILLPWNIVLTQVGFLKSFVGASSSCLAFYVSISFSLPLLPATYFALVATSRVPLKIRILGSYGAQVLLLFSLLLVERAGGLGFLLCVVVLVSSFTVLMQSSLYGYASTLSPELTRALVIGQGSTGLIASAIQFLTQIIAATTSTTASSSDDDDNNNDDSTAATGGDWAAAIASSSLGAILVLAGAVGFYWLFSLSEDSTPTTRLSVPESPKKSSRLLSGSMSSPPGSPRHRDLLLPPCTLPASTLSPSASSSSLSSIAAPTTTTLEMKPLLLVQNYDDENGEYENPRTTIEILRSESWMSITALFLTLFVTMLVFPGVLLNLQYKGGFGALKDDDTWWPVLLLLFYNASDCVGRFLPSLVEGFFSFQLSDSQLLGIAISRFLLVPLLITNLPDMVSVLCAIVLGFTNGFLQLETLIAVPQRTRPNEREKIGTLLSATINVGIVIGSCVALALSPQECSL